MFKTEPHLHVKEVSRCSRLTAAEMMSLYKNAGYTTVFVSDHLTSATVEAHFSGLSWREKVDGFFRGYEAARAVGEEIGIRVLPSAELTYNHSSNHYLLYGFDKEFFYAIPELFDMPKSEFYSYAHTHGVTVVQAHPYRDAKTVPDSPDIIDAIEVYNENPRHENYSEDALTYALENGLPITGGSDAHRTEDVGRGGVMTEVEITSTAEYVSLLTLGALVPITASEVG